MFKSLQVTPVTRNWPAAPPNIAAGLWRADLPNEVGAYNRLEQDEDNVYVLAQGRALAFNVVTTGTTATTWSSVTPFG